MVVDDTTHAWLLANPGAEVEIDLAEAQLRIDGRDPTPFPIEAFSRYCLLNGVDELGFLLSQDAAISAYESAALNARASG